MNKPMKPQINTDKHRFINKTMEFNYPNSTSVFICVHLWLLEGVA